MDIFQMYREYLNGKRVARMDAISNVTITRALDLGMVSKMSPDVNAQREVAVQHFVAQIAPDFSGSLESFDVANVRPSKGWFDG